MRYVCDFNMEQDGHCDMEEPNLEIFQCKTSKGFALLHSTLAGEVVTKQSGELLLGLARIFRRGERGLLAIGS